MRPSYQSRDQRSQYLRNTVSTQQATLLIAALTCTMMVTGCGSRQYYSSISKRPPASATKTSQSTGHHKIGRPYTINGRTYVPRHEPDYNRVGVASWYGQDFHGRQTANGEIYDKNALSAAHPTLPLPSYVRVTNLENGVSRVVRVNDRGPFVAGRIIDLSLQTARELNFASRGLAKVRVEYVGPAPL